MDSYNCKAVTSYTNMEALRLSTDEKYPELGMHRITNEALEDFLSQVEAVDLTSFDKGRVSRHETLEHEGSAHFITFQISGVVGWNDPQLHVFDIRMFEEDEEETQHPIDLTHKQEKIIKDWFYGSVDV